MHCLYSFARMWRTTSAGDGATVGAKSRALDLGFRDQMCDREVEALSSQSAFGKQRTWSATVAASLLNNNPHPAQ